MTITTLDETSALLVVDLQKGTLGVPTAHPMRDVLANAAGLTAAFRRRNLPVVLINVDGVATGRTEQARSRPDVPAGWTELAPELNRQTSDHVVTKRTWGAFTRTGLEDYLRQRGVTQVVIAGVATSMGVESTTRHAHELGFNVALATDAMTDRSPEAHDRSIEMIFPKLGETGPSQQIVDWLQGSRAA